MAAIIPITTFVGLGLEHSVANMFFIPMAMKLGADISVRDFLVRASQPHTPVCRQVPATNSEHPCCL
jgi:formate transporter